MDRQAGGGAQRRQVAQDGWMVVRGASAWITRDGEASDYVLDAGERLAVWAGDALVIEPWIAGEVVRIEMEAAAPAGPALGELLAALPGAIRAALAIRIARRRPRRLPSGHAC